MPSRASLVCQHLENVSREALEKYQGEIRGYVRHRQGVYALYRRRKLYYVGLARDLRWRLKQHLRDHHGQSWDRFSVYFTRDDQHLKELETLLLRIVKPSGNKVLGNFSNSENLRRRLTRDIKRRQDEERRELFGRGFEEELSRVPIKQENGRQPILAPYVTRPFQLRASQWSKKFKARVRRDGAIRFGGRVYNSPSAAGAKAIGHACDGWFFWKYERAPGEWVRLDELRK